MLIFIKGDCRGADLDAVLTAARALDPEARLVPCGSQRAVALAGTAEPGRPDVFESMAGVERVVPVSRPLHRVCRAPDQEARSFEVGDRAVGGGGLTIVAGPCAVESEPQLIAAAEHVRRAGADLLRGGAYKPRTSPHEFQGLGEDGLKLLARAREATGLGIVTEAVDARSFALVERYADVVQIGARNMQNFELLKLVGRSRLPVLLKRGMSATLEELLMAAEYVLEGGNERVILCERGIRTFSDHSRYTLDLSIVPALRNVTALPVFVDPSHASGRRQSVAPLARAAVAAGADGVMIEVHPDPSGALCDGPQSLTPSEFASLAVSLRAVSACLTRQQETVP